MRTRDLTVGLTRDLVRPGRRSQERGAAAIIIALFIAAILLPISALGVDVARWYVEAQRLQAAADAAATAGVTFLPDDFNSAVTRARAVAKTNGYENGVNATVTVARGIRPTQLKVTITTPVHNAFGQAFGIGTTDVGRAAVADYNGPAPMGSPCNTFGNEPAGTSGAPPVASQLTVPTGATCTTTPDFWGSINGPDIHKTQGEEFASRKCENAEDGCDSSKNNTEFDPLGYFYVVRVTQANIPVTIQIYDPASVPTGQQCESRPNWTTSDSNNANGYTNSDARARYGGTGVGNSRLCPGDNDMQGTSTQTSEQPTVTSFGLRNPTDTLVPTQGTPITACAKQFKGFSESQVTKNALKDSSGSYNTNLASVFHQWVTLCTFTPTTVGDYYLQVRANVAFNGTASQTVTSGNPAIYSQMVDNTAVKGTAVNSFALRAYGGGGTVSISAWKSMRIFVNGANANTTFNLVRVVPAAQGKTLKFGLFDVGEGAASGAYVQLIPPADAKLGVTPMTTISGCSASGYVTASGLTNCRLGISTAFNGKQQYISAPIPSNYTCNWASQGGCWWRVTVNFNGSSGVHDATTWTASIQGEPIRLIE